MTSRCPVLFLFVLSVIFAGMNWQASGAEPDAAATLDRLPNILLILADDLGYGDAGCYNRQSKIPTPHIDRLAAGGMRFTDAHSPSSVCSPTRYGLLTGRYAWRTELKSQVLWAFDRPLIEPDRLTLPKLLAPLGYRADCIGKWHLGWEWKLADGSPLRLPMKIGERGPHAERVRLARPIDYTQPLGGGPLGAGFQTYFGDDVINQPPFLWIEDNRCLTLPTLAEHPAILRGSSNGPATKDWDQRTVLPKLAAKAVRYLRDRGEKPAEPFLLYLPLTAPHLPIVPPEEFSGRSTYGPYGDFVCYVDAIVGQVTQALQEADLAEQTLVLFTSDNGSYAPAAGGHLPNGPLRGRKGEIYEGGHRVPMIVRWPGKVTAGGVNDQLVGLNDLLATVAALARQPLPAGAGEDSVNLLPTLFDSSAVVRQRLVHHSAAGEFALRDGRWKLIPATQQLFDMQSDPQEQHNLWAEQPAVVARLAAQLREIQQGD